MAPVVGCSRAAAFSDGPVQRQHLSSRKAHPRIYGFGTFVWVRRRSADLVGRFEGDDLQPAVAVVDGAVGLGNVALRVVSHRAFRRRHPGRHHVRVRALPLRSLSSPRAASHDLPAADTALLRAADRSSIHARCLADVRLLRRAGVFLHLLLGVPRDRADPDRRNTSMEPARRSARERDS